MPTHTDRERRRRNKRPGDIAQASQRRQGQRFYDFQSGEIRGGGVSNPPPQPGGITSPGNSIADQTAETRANRDQFFEESRFPTSSRPAYDPATGSVTQEPTQTRPRTGGVFQSPTRDNPNRTLGPAANQTVGGIGDVARSIGTAAKGTVSLVPSFLGDVGEGALRELTGSRAGDFSRTRGAYDTLRESDRQLIGGIRQLQGAGREQFGFEPSTAGSNVQEGGSHPRSDQSLSRINVDQELRGLPGQEPPGRSSTNTPGIDRVVNPDGSVTFTNVGGDEETDGSQAGANRISVVPSQGRGLTRPSAPRAGAEAAIGSVARGGGTSQPQNRGVFNPVTRQFDTRADRERDSLMSMLRRRANEAQSRGDQEQVGRLTDLMEDVFASEAGVRQQEAAGQAGVQQQRIASQGRVSAERARGNTPAARAEAGLFDQESRATALSADQLALQNSLQRALVSSDDPEERREIASRLQQLTGTGERADLITVTRPGAMTEHGEFTDEELLYDPNTDSFIQAPQSPAVRQQRIDQIRQRFDRAGLGEEDFQRYLESQGLTSQ